VNPPKPVKAVLSSADVGAMLHRGGPTERDPLAPARFAIGDRVRMKTINPPTHTRLPRYVRGRVGTIELMHGAHVFADTNSLGDEIKRAQAAGDPDTAETYYRHWLATLESLVADKSVITREQLHRYRDAWDHAADRTPHGTPIELRDEDFS